MSSKDIRPESRVGMTIVQMVGGLIVFAGLVAGAVASDLKTRGSLNEFRQELKNLVTIDDMVEYEGALSPLYIKEGLMQSRHRSLFRSVIRERRMLGQQSAHLETHKPVYRGVMPAQPAMISEE